MIYTCNCVRMDSGHCFILHTSKDRFGTLFWRRHKPADNKLTECWQHVGIFLYKSIIIKVFSFCGVCRSYLPVVAVLGKSTADFRQAGPTTVTTYWCRSVIVPFSVRRNAFIPPRPPTNAQNFRPASSFGRRRGNNRQISPRSQIHDLQMSRNFQHSNQGYTRTHNPHVPGQENM
jgi:hypothetical protein